MNTKISKTFFACLIAGSLLASNALAKKDETCKTVTNIPKIKGMKYHEARKLIIKEGWIVLQPIYPKNESPFGIFDSFKTYPEVQGCAGTGVAPCAMLFTDNTQELLRIVTIGEDDPTSKSFAVVDNIKPICNF